MSREIMQQALNALIQPHPHIRTSFTDAIKYREKIDQAIAALEAELAKPEQAEKQEPVALNKNMTLECPAYLHDLAKPKPKLTDAGAETNIDPFTLYPKGSGMVTLNQVGMRVDLKDAPPRKEWVGLTDDELMKEFGYSDELLKNTAYRVDQLLEWKNT
jgi:hypothetical protein